MRDSLKLIAQFYPEVQAGGYTSIDGTVEFYGRVNSLLKPSMTVLDFGAGRAAWYQDDPCEYRKGLRLIKGKVTRVVGCDVDTALLVNASIDQAVLIQENAPLPFKDNSFDLVLSDYTFEHIRDPDSISRELVRVLRPGGWICARTPNKYGIISILTRMVKNSYHTRLLARVQPERKAIDVFPTAFRLNTLRDINKYFDPGRFKNYSYRWDPEPAYFFNKKPIFFMTILLNRFLPQVFRANIFIFLQKQ